MIKVFTSLISFAAAAQVSIRGSASCEFQNTTMHHASSKYLTGNELTPGSIYVICRNGKAECLIEEAEADSPNTQTIDCSEADSSHRKLQIFDPDESDYWPEGVVCYLPISTSVFDEEKRGIIDDAFAHFHEKTNLKFIPLPECSGNVCGDCKNAIEFVDNNKCSSMVGYQDEATQHLSLGDGCFGDIDTTVHELGHAVGMQHEHYHPDRTMIMVPANFGDRDPSKFKKKDRNEYRMSEYDPLSVMHYGFDVEKGRCMPKAGTSASDYCDVGETGDCIEPTVDDCDEEATEEMEDRRGGGLSEGDVRVLNEIYPGSKTDVGSDSPSPAGDNDTPEVSTPDAPSPVRDDDTPESSTGDDDSSRVCDKNDDSYGDCCTETQSCDVGQGDCDSDDDCLDGLKCGENNCKSDFDWGKDSTDCCYRPE